MVRPARIASVVVAVTLLCAGAARAETRCIAHSTVLPGVPEASRCSFLAEEAGTLAYGGTGKWKIDVPLPTVFHRRTDSGTEAGAHLGQAIAIGDMDDDGSPDLVVGAPGAGGGHGAVYVYTGDTPLIVPAPPDASRFGASIAIADLTSDGKPDLVVGAPGASGEGAGRVYLLSGSGAPPSFMSGDADGDRFGSRVATGDLTGDGHPDLVVGAPGAGGGAGRIWIFGGAAGSMIDGEPGEELGESLAVADLDGDGALDIAAGGPGGGGGGGVILTVTNEGRDRLRVTPTAQTTGRFGSSLAVGDLTGDGIPDLVVGAPGTGEETGAVVLVDGVSHKFVWDYRADLGAGARLGSSLAVADINGDGRPDVVAGAPGSPGAGSPGSFMIVSHHGRLLDEHDSPVESSRLGVALALADLNGDGRADVVVGAPLRDGTGAFSTYLTDTVTLSSTDSMGGTLSVSSGTFVTLEAEATTDGTPSVAVASLVTP